MELAKQNESEDIHKIIKSLSKEDSDHVGGGYWVNSDHVIYRKVHYVNKEPVGFIDVYELPRSKNIGMVILAVDGKYRGQGIARRMSSEMIRHFKSKKSNIEKLRWLVDVDNMASARLAESLGFKRNPSHKNKDEYEYLYELR